MEVHAAVALAKKYVTDLFADEQIENLGLEEVLYNDENKIWSITLGFSRPWNTPRSVSEGTLSALAQMGKLDTISKKRSYKMIRIQDNTEKVIDVINREHDW